MALFTRDNKTRYKNGNIPFTTEPNMTYIVNGLTSSYTIGVDQSAFYSGDWFEVYVSDTSISPKSNSITIDFTSTGKTFGHSASTDFLIDESNSYVRFVYTNGNWKDVVLDAGDIVLEDDRIVNASANTVIEDGFTYLVDSSLNPVVLTVPNTITHPCKFKVLDKKGTFSSTNYCKIDFTTNNFKLEGQAKDFTITESNIGYEFISSEATYGFKPFKLLQEQEGVIDWLTGTNYSVGKYCNHDGLLWKCILPHTSTSNFYTDVASGDWEIVSGHNYYEKLDVTGNTVLSKWQQLVYADISANTTITLPNADETNKFKEISIIRVDSNYGSSLTVKCPTGQYLNGELNGIYTFTSSDKAITFINIGGNNTHIITGVGKYDYSVLKIQSDTTISSFGNLCFVDASASPITIKLPAIESSINEKTFIVKTDNSFNTITIETSDTSFAIDGITNGNYKLNNPYESVLFCSSGKDTYSIATSKTNNYALIDVNTTSALTEFNSLYSASSSASDISLTLPKLEHVNQSGKRITIKKISNDSNEISILVPVSHKIDNVLNGVVTLSNPNDTYIFVADYENLEYKVISNPSSKSLSSVVLNTVENRTLNSNTIYEVESTNVVGSVYTLSSTNNKDNEQIIIKISCGNLNYENNQYFTINGNINGNATETIIGNVGYSIIILYWSSSNSTWIYER